MYKYYQNVTNHKKLQNFNYKPLKSPTEVSHSSLPSWQYQTRFFGCVTFLRVQLKTLSGPGPRPGHRKKRTSKGRTP